MSLKEKATAEDCSPPASIALGVCVCVCVGHNALTMKDSCAVTALKLFSLHRMLLLLLLPIFVSCQ